MSFTGKATYSAGPSLPEIAEDVSDIVSIVSPFETPLLDHLGDPSKAATSTVHEWLEDSLLPNTDSIADGSINDPLTDPSFGVANPTRFREGDQIQLDGKAEVMLVTGVFGNTLTVTRQYGATPGSPIVDGDEINILGNAALEGDDAPGVRFKTRVRKQNFTQIFTASAEVSGSQQAVQTIGIADELDYQKQERLRELIRDLENCVINGVAPEVDPQGDATTRRSMRGLLAAVQSNVWVPGADPLPVGDGSKSDLLTEPMLNAALRAVWEESSGMIDTIVCGGFQKRRINGFIAAQRRYGDQTHLKSLVDVYESDFGVCRVVMTRWVPQDTILLLDSARASVLPLNGRSFHFVDLARTGDSASGQIIGEYTLELRNENAHAVISGLGVSE